MQMQGVLVHGALVITRLSLDCRLLLPLVCCFLLSHDTCAGTHVKLACLIQPFTAACLQDTPCLLAGKVCKNSDNHSDASTCRLALWLAVWLAVHARLHGSEWSWMLLAVSTQLLMTDNVSCNDYRSLMKMTRLMRRTWRSCATPSRRTLRSGKRPLQLYAYPCNLGVRRTSRL